jgi:hypothetical protein
MFFNKNKKIGKQIAIAVLNSFRPVFAFSKYMDLNTGVFLFDLSFIPVEARFVMKA